MYNESEIEAALTYRNQNAVLQKYKDAENELLASIKFASYEREIIKPGSREYRRSFINALADNGISIIAPNLNRDQKWHFKLPDIMEVTDERLFS